MHRSRLTILVGAVIGLVAVPLPLVRFPASGNVGILEGDGWPAVVLIAVAALLALLGDRAEGLAMPSAVVAAAAAGLAVVFSALKLADASSAVDMVPGATIGIAAWVLLVASLITLAGTALTVSRKLG